MDFKFGKFIPFSKIPDGNDIDNEEYGFIGDLAKGGIYMAFSGETREDVFIPTRLLYIGKATDKTNSLGKRINEHGEILTGHSESDHSKWKRIAQLDRNETIGYCFVALDDMTYIEDIEAKLIFNNQPPCNIKGKEKDCSSERCPHFKISFEHQCACTKCIVGNDTLQSFLKNSVGHLKS